MATRILPIAEVIELIGLSRRTVYQEIANDRFPKPVQLTARRVGWLEADIEKWIAQKIVVRGGGSAQ